MKKLIVCHATGETVLHKAARLGYEVQLEALVLYKHAFQFHSCDDYTIVISIIGHFMAFVAIHTKSGCNVQTFCGRLFYLVSVHVVCVTGYRSVVLSYWVREC